MNKLRTIKKSNNPEMISVNKILSVRQYAKQLGISRQAVLKQIHAGKVFAIKVDNFYIVFQTKQ